jgi:hypothetical protein
MYITIKNTEKQMKINLCQLNKMENDYQRMINEKIPSEKYFLPQIWREQAFNIWDILRNKKYEDCSICIQEMNPFKEELTKSTNCGHRFHKKCISMWQENNLSQVEVIKYSHLYKVGIFSIDCPLCKEPYATISKMEEKKKKCTCECGCGGITR